MSTFRPGVLRASQTEQSRGDSSHHNAQPKAQCPWVNELPRQCPFANNPYKMARISARQIYPIRSIYGIYAYIDPPNHPHVWSVWVLERSTHVFTSLDPQKPYNESSRRPRRNGGRTSCDVQAFQLALRVRCHTDSRYGFAPCGESESQSGL